MDEFEIQITRDVGSIKCNFKDIKEALKQQMMAYTSLEITEEKQKEAKADLAVLRKIRKAMEDKRKALKNEFMQPYMDFEKEYKDMLAVIDEPINLIDEKLKGFEEKRVHDREAHIEEIYKEMIGEYASYLPLERIKKESWSNKSTTDKSIVFDISEEVTRVRSHIDAIKALHSEIEEECLEAYRLAGNDLTAAITKNSDYLFAKSLAEQKLKEKHEEDGAFAEESKEEPVVIPDISEELPFTSVKPPKDDIFTFRITGKDVINRVKEYLDFNEIPYQEV